MPTLWVRCGACQEQFPNDVALASHRCRGAVGRQAVGMTRAAAAEQYARALGNLLYAKVKLVAHPQSPSISCDAGMAEREIAAAMLVLTDHAPAALALVNALLTSVEGPARDRA